MNMINKTLCFFFHFKRVGCVKKEEREWLIKMSTVTCSIAAKIGAKNTARSN